MTENEHFSGLVASAKIQDRDWLAIGLSLAGIGMLALAGAVGFAAWSLLVASAKIKDGVDVQVRQIATSTMAYEKAIQYYDPGFKAAPPPVSPSRDPSESPFDR